ncbi:MAG: RNA polymerase sigma factor [Flavobacteriaceae bacterium]|nr:RNA polymerase sigma factor [Flavobacteriaceae bacterium]
MSQLTDEELMQRVSQGELDLMTVLFDRYHVRIFNFFNKMVQNKMVSEDLTQDVFVKILKYRTSYKSGNFASWIFTTARNIFSTYYQKLKKDREKFTESEHLKHTEDVVSESNQEELNHLQKALSYLNHSDRELIIMNRFQEIKYEQIAEITGSNENAVKVKTHRALKKLKDIYFKTVAD